MASEDCGRALWNNDIRYAALDELFNQSIELLDYINAATERVPGGRD